MRAHETGGHRVGELAAASGLTVRALHYYEEIGLLRPSARSDAGHRLYSGADVERLYRITLLRRSGLSLAEISRALSDPQWDLRSALAAHLANIDARLDAERRLRARVAQLVASSDAGGAAAQQILRLLEDMAMTDTNVQRRISVLVYADVEAAYEHLTRVFGLGPGTLTRDAEGRVVHAEIQAGDGVLWLHPEAPKWRLASPRTLGAATAMVAVLVDDVDTHFREARDRGATIRYEPVDQPYGYREYGANDLEGGLWSFMKPIV